MKKHLAIAFKEYGVKEFVGQRDNPEVLKYFDEIGFNGSKLKDETAWCSAFVNWVLKTSDAPYTGKLNARSWLQIGKETNCPQVGDIVVFWRGSKRSWKGHVGFFINAIDDKIFVLGGNQNNQVKISSYPKGRLLGYRVVA
ncbi:MAG: TIGR02594 family protein [Flavobacteriaceae bacterium]|nr:TIGR02594 family protein [Flavobacteriaceae bacterium]